MGSILHDKEGWQAFCRRVEREDAYLILGGDLINNNTRNAVGSPFEDYIRPREQKKMMVEMLTPIKDKILCAVSGNHEARTARDTDQDIMGDIMCKLDMEDYYAEDIAFLKLEIGRRVTRDIPITSYTMAVTHGSGGGIYTGATVNRNERFGYTIEGIDALIVGHTHKGTISKPKKIVVDSNNNVIRTKQLVVVSCTAWQQYGWHFYWDTSVTGDKYVGELRGETVDALNFFVANPQLRDVQKQDYLIIAQRLKLGAVRKMAKDRGLPAEKVANICPDEFEDASTYQAERIELDGKENEKVTVLTKYYRKNGEVVFDKATRSVEICKAVPLTPQGSPVRIKLYPVAALNWKLRKACFYGIGEIEGLIPNQKLINFMYGMQALAIQQMGFPKIVARPGAIRQPLTNEPGEIVTDYSNGGISYLQPPAFSSAATQVSNDMIDLTRVVTGTTEVTTGESLGANMAASAIIALQNQAQTPVNEIQRRYWHAVKEIGRIWMEFFKTYCSDKRDIVIEMGDEVSGRAFTGTDYAMYDFDLQVDVGASSEYSAVLAQATPTCISRARRRPRSRSSSRKFTTAEKRPARRR